MVWGVIYASDTSNMIVVQFLELRNASPSMAETGRKRRKSFALRSAHHSAHNTPSHAKVTRTGRPPRFSRPSSEKNEKSKTEVSSFFRHFGYDFI